jgi:drug/metabolite transporter (DMT)-like permease
LPAVGALAATIFLWAGSFAAVRASVGHFGPLPLTSARLLIAALAFAGLSLAVRIRLPARADWGRLLLAGLLGMSGYQLLLNSGQVRVTAATASVIIATSPVIAVLLARALLGEQLTVLRAIGVAVAFVGAAIAAGGDSNGLRLEPASLLIFAAAASQAGYFVVLKPLLATYSPVEATAWTTWLAALSSLPLAADLPKAVVGAPTVANVAVLALGIGS